MPLPLSTSSRVKVAKRSCNALLIGNETSPAGGGHFPPTTPTLTNSSRKAPGGQLGQRSRTRTIEDRTNTGYWRPERSLRCPPAARLTPSQAGRHPRRHSPESVPAPGPDLFRRHKRLATSLALLVHRILCRSCLQLNAECQAPV